jgi:4-alpha-glucanotransferase
VKRDDELRELARLYGVQTAYHDALGQYREATPESLLAVLAALDTSVEGMGDVPEALCARREELALRLVEPVVVAWEGGPLDLDLHWDLRPQAGDGSALACHIDLEDGGRRGWIFDPDTMPAVRADGTRRLTLPERLPPGYHRLRLTTGRRSGEAMVISAPRRAFGAEGDPLWGVFLPLYALRTRRSWGAGDLTDLEALSRWVSSLGGGIVATLPLLAAFLDEPFEPSPYAPASRLFWNELYLDPRVLPELEESAAAQRLVESAEFRREVDALRDGALVDYRELMITKRRVFEEMAHRFFSRPSRRHEEFERFVQAHSEVETYAAFRAVGDRRGEAWPSWPERLREGTLAPADYDEEDRRYHLWVQWATAEQMRALATEARRHGPGLYLDLPLGVGGASYDVWRERAIFARGASAGAPPDSLFTKGQNWGFPPLSPERQREAGYRYLIASLRHHLEHAGVLRLDHVMQLHRLFWIPDGMAAQDGVYVSYPAEDLYAILSLESHRHEAVIVGENLGTVPPEVGEAMERHGILGMYVVQYELQPGSEGQLRPPPADSVASLNTHDMPTFRSFWEGKDVDNLEGLGFFSAEEARAERERRRALRQGLAGLLQPPGKRDEAETYRAVLHDRLAWLAKSPARMVLVNLEDLWQEAEPQNVPGTHTERPNWQRKAKLGFEEFSTKPEVVEPLRGVNGLREERKRNG